MAASLRPFLVTFSLLAGMFCTACEPDPLSDRFKERTFEGYWRVGEVSKAHFVDGILDTTITLQPGGSFLFDVDEVYNDDPMFISAELADSLHSLHYLLQSAALTLTGNGNELRGHWAYPADQDTLTIGGYNTAGTRVAVTYAMQLSGEEMVLLYRQRGGNPTQTVLEEIIHLTKD